MVRKLAVAVFALVVTIPAFAHNTQMPTAQFATGPSQPVLRLMNDTEFSSFLSSLDSDLVRAQLSLEKMDVKSVSLDVEENQELERGYGRCLQSLDNARDEIQKLSQKQTLKLDLYLLIDLNQLGRNLDLLGESMVNPNTVNGSSGARKALEYAKEILTIDGGLVPQISTFQHHFIAFTGVVDATLDQPESNSDSDADELLPLPMPPAQK